MVSIYKNIKRETGFWISKSLPIKIKKGISKGLLLYGNLFYNRRPNELHEEEFLYSNLDLKGKVIIEAGSHIGIHTLFFAKQINSGNIIAFEPNPLNYYFLCKNIKINSFTNVIPVNAGLADKEGILHFLSYRYNSAKGTFKTDKQEIIKKSKKKLTKIDVPVTTIDNAVKKYSLDTVDFVKIDTEGFEPYVIEGMKITLEKFNPVLYFEIHGLNDSQKQEDLKRIIKFIMEFGYVVVKLSKGLPQVTRDNIEKFGGGGYIAYQKMDKSLEQAVGYWKNYT
ncbi:MAG: hypothetical protein A2163_08190 [Actinobacteria bacterium RBG_13_35_12]|nr:MAG: hypothetical protein A2163_08190 [Actinobacteria bacterium RBG_13_35_12]